MLLCSVAGVEHLVALRPEHPFGPGELLAGGLADDLLADLSATVNFNILHFLQILQDSIRKNRGIERGNKDERKKGCMVV